MVAWKVDPETTDRAVEALLKWIKSKALHEKSQLLEHDEFVYLILTLKKIPTNGRTNPHRIPLPNPLHPLDASEELCLIVDDRPKSSLTSHLAKKKIQTENIPISKVLKFSKLKSDYRSFEAKRKLCSSYDLFFADKRVIPMLPRCLGKEFFKKKKIPIGVDLGRKNWKEQVEAACSSALLFLRTGTCSVVKVGRISQSREEIAENVSAVIHGAAHIVPGNWGNIRSIHLKVSQSLALPIYQAVPAVAFKIEGVKEDQRQDKSVEDDDKSGEDESENKQGNRKKKRGRIHEVRYMDNMVGEEFDNVFSDKDDDLKDALEVPSDELTGKTRKKSGKVKVKDDYLNGEKVLKKLGKAKKGEAVKKNKIKIEEVDREDGNDNVKLPVTNGIDTSVQAAKKRSSVVIDEEDLGLPVGVKKSAKLKDASKLKKHALIEAKGEEQEADDDEEAASTPTSGYQLEKKNKTGKTKGIKLKTKKSKRV